MVAHPECPCTTASLHALRDLVVKADGRLKATVMFVGKEGAGTRNERAANDIPDVDVSWIDASQARRYGAITSGHVTLYHDGVPIFEGGVTASRGVEGASAGRVAIQAALRGGSFAPLAPVYGCPLSLGDDR
jgi:hypothetical protein